MNHPAVVTCSVCAAAAGYDIWAARYCAEHVPARALGMIQYLSPEEWQEFQIDGTDPGTEEDQ